MNYQDFQIRVARSRDGYRVSVTASPAGETGVPAEVDPVAVGPSPERLGEKLFATLFPEPVRALLDASRGHLQGQQREGRELGLRLKIYLAPGDPDLAWLATVPWEFLFRPDGMGGGRFLALDRTTSIVRYLEVPEPPALRPFTGRLRVLAVASAPRGLLPLGLCGERQRIRQAWGTAPEVEVTVLEGPTRERLREALSHGAVDILHFMGHGAWDRAAGQGILFLETSDREPDRVSGRWLAGLMRGPAAPRLVVLNACDSGHGESGFAPFAGVATALVAGGLTAVVAMQFPISDEAALVFSSALHQRLVRDGSIDAAVAEGRIAVHSQLGTTDWATPTLFLRVPDGRLFGAGGGDAPAEGGPASGVDELEIDADEIRAKSQVFANLVRDQNGDAGGGE